MNDLSIIPYKPNFDSTPPSKETALDFFYCETIPQGITQEEMLENLVFQTQQALREMERYLDLRIEEERRERENLAKEYIVDKKELKEKIHGLEEKIKGLEEKLAKLQKRYAEVQKMYENARQAAQFMMAWREKRDRKLKNWLNNIEAEMHARHKNNFHQAEKINAGIFWTGVFTCFVSPIMGGILISSSVGNLLREGIQSSFKEVEEINKFAIIKEMARTHFASYTELNPNAKAKEVISAFKITCENSLKVE